MKDRRFPSQAIGYTRTSTRHQAAGLEQQAEAIRVFAKQFRIDVPMIFADEGVSGMCSKKAAERPDLSGALTMAKELSCPLIMTDIKRLTRTPAVVRTLWGEFNVDIICVNDATILTPRMILDRVREGHRQGIAIQKGTRRAVQGRPSPALSVAAEEARRQGGIRGSKNNAANADDLVRSIAGLLEKEDPDGRLTKAQVATLLNSHGVAPRLGESWDHENVRRHLDRARSRIALERELTIDDEDW